MTHVVSLNGPDNVGKTTHLAWLAHAIDGATVSGSINRWHPRWTEVAAGDFARWWFCDSTTEEHVRLVFDSHERRRGSNRGLAITLEDRGWPMLLALCAATSVVKDSVAPTDALATVQRLVADRPVGQADGIHVLLRHGEDQRAEAEWALAREPEALSPWYPDYQRALAQVIDAQVNQGSYDCVIVRGDRSILDIQRDIRAALANHGVAAEALPVAALTRVWVLGGLSESGKTTVGELLRDEHGVTRLKIGYLLDVAGARAGVSDPYAAWSETEQAERLAEEVLRFSAASKASTISLESAHRYEATNHLRRVLGDVARIVYVDASQDQRFGRSDEASASLLRRDETKVARGADEIADIADCVIDNSGSLAALKLAVTRMVRRTEWTSCTAVESRSRTFAADDWLPQIAAHLTDDATAAVLATGSATTDEWLPGWSDVDILVIRDGYTAEWLRRAGLAPPHPAGAKVAITYVTLAEINAGMVMPRLVHALRRIQYGHDGILYWRAGLTLPVPTADDDDRASRGELGLVTITLRRLLAAQVADVRAVHKHVLLIMKILLRADGIAADTYTEVTQAFEVRFPIRMPLPEPARLANRTLDAESTSGVVRSAHSVLDLLASIDHIATWKVR